MKKRCKDNCKNWIKIHSEKSKLNDYGYNFSVKCKNCGFMDGGRYVNESGPTPKWWKEIDKNNKQYK